ncbi:MAG: mechanosensitive ion channel family protein [Halobacteriota archaeon]
MLAGSVPLQVVDATVNPLVQAGKFVAAFLVTYLAGRFLVEPSVAEVIRRRNRNNPTIQEAARLYTRVGVLVASLVVGIAAAGYGYLLTRSALIIAAGTLAIGVAGQAVIGNLVSGMFLVSDPNFNVGDWISWEGNEGVVESIAFRVTRVRTPDFEVVTVPNTELATSAVSRPYSRGRYRLTETLGIAYGDDVDEAMNLLGVAAEQTEGVLDDPEPLIRLVEFGDTAVVLESAYWLGNPSHIDILEIESEYSRQVKRLFDEAGITIAPPSPQTLSGKISVDERPSTVDE